MPWREAARDGGQWDSRAGGEGLQGSCGQSVLGSGMGRVEDGHQEAGSPWPAVGLGGQAGHCRPGRTPSPNCMSTAPFLSRVEAWLGLRFVPCLWASGYLLLCSESQPSPAACCPRPFSWPAGASLTPTPFLLTGHSEGQGGHSPRTEWWPPAEGGSRCPGNCGVSRSDTLTCWSI